MQLSAANLLLASQQLARSVQQSPRDAQAQFAAALAKAKSAPSATPFEPIDFEQAAPEPPAAIIATPGAAAPGPAGRLGANLDIRV